MTFHDDETRLVNPCKKFLKFSGEKVSYYDKEAKENVPVPLPFKFIALIDLKAISGFDEAHNCGIFSNEIQNLGQQFMKVRSFKGGDIACGLYSDIKDKAKAAGGRFTCSVYGLLDGELVNLQLRGAALSGWIDKQPGTKFELGKFTKGKKGSVSYSIPTFSPAAFDDDDEKKLARETLDDLMTNYLQPYWAKNQEELAVFHSNPLNDDVALGKVAEHIKATKQEIKPLGIASTDKEIIESDLPF
tara:strand:- start:7703 stop:8437 length:735 start_codon:yes stop_codon:yes gene_type:complete